MSETLPPLETLRPPASDEAPKVPFYHMWTGENGQSTLDACLMGGFGKKSVGGGAAPQWMRPFPGKVGAVQFAVLPPGWVGEWHESPKPQWVVTLSGRWFLETMDGKRVEMGPGEPHFGQDQGTEGERGHRSGCVGDEPCVQLMLQFETSPAAQTPCPFA